MYKELFSHIVKYLVYQDFLTDPKFLTDRTVGVEFEDSRVDYEVSAAEGKISDSVLKLMTVKIDSERWLLLQFDDLTIYALKFDNYDEHSGQAWFFHSERGWVELGSLLLAKLLVGVEQVKEIFVDFKPMPKTEDLFKHLLDVIEFYESTTEKEQETIN